LKRILYVETNFTVGIAKGQDPDASAFLEHPDPDISLVFPGVCYMESFSNISHEMRTRGGLYKGIKTHAEEVKRDRTSPKASGLALDLENSILKGDELLSDIKMRLYEALGRISRAPAEIIETDQNIIQDCLDHNYLEDPTDNLIFCCVLHHARRNPQDIKAFLSGNSEDFGKPDVIATLASAGVKYFKVVNNAIGWLKSRSSSDPNPAPPT
jgi:hypothetical protein